VGKFVAIVGIGQGGPDGFLSIDDYSPGDGDGFIYTYSPDPQAYGIRVRGDSMRPRIKSGEYIVAEPSVEALPGDDVVVKLKSGKAMVKELLWIRDDEISFGSINNGIPPVTVPSNEIQSIHRVAAIVPRGSALLRARI
jgi:phage repressor protein C with HTH and peptisase S24 domain